MNENLVKQSWDEANAGVQEMRNRRKDEAGKRFWNALNLLDGVADAQVKRDALGPLALLFANVGFYDLALMGAQEAIEIDEKLNDLPHLAEDIITRGNVKLRVGQKKEAEGDFRKALEICQGLGNYGDAASASTNLAMIVFNDGRMDEAIELLKNSLAYLEKKPFPNTEMITRITLIQALGTAQREPELLLETAKKLFTRFSDKLRADHGQVINGHVNKAVERHVQDHPVPNVDEWKRQNFPWIYG